MKATRIGSFVTLPMAVLLIILFFLPWLELSCKNEAMEIKMGKASGWQLTRGTMSAISDPDEALPTGAKIKPEKPTPEQQAKQQEKMNETFKARPWFALGLILPVALLLVGVKALSPTAIPASTGLVLLVLALAGVAVVIMATQVSYTDEIMAAQEKDQPPKPTAGADPGNAMGEAMANSMQAQIKLQMKQALKTTPTAGLWITLAAYIALAATGTAVMALGKTSRPATASPAGGTTTSPPI